MAVTALPQKTAAGPGACSEAEWRTRVDLAALYRILHHLRMTDLIYTHLSARVPDEEGTFLINRYGDMFDEVTASSLVKTNFDGEVVAPAGTRSRGDGEFNAAGFNIHSGAYMARPDANCVAHTHTRAGIAVGITEGGLRPLTQHSLMVYDEVVYHDYDGPGVLEEREAVGASCAAGNCVIMRNHGLLAMGDTIHGTFKRLYYLEQACQLQTEAQATGQPLREIPADVQAATAKLWTRRRAEPAFGQREWTSLTRMLERIAPGYDA